MDPNQRTSGALLDRANANIAQLLRRFENVIGYGGDDKAAPFTAAVSAYQMEVETAALVKAAEDVLSLTRVLKEMWLFGRLQTVGTGEAERRTEESVRGVIEVLEARRRGGDTTRGEKEELAKNGEEMRGGGEEAKEGEKRVGIEAEDVKTAEGGVEEDGNGDIELDDDLFMDDGMQDL